MKSPPAPPPSREARRLRRAAGRARRAIERDPPPTSAARAEAILQAVEGHLVAFLLGSGDVRAALRCYELLRAGAGRPPVAPGEPSAAGPEAEWKKILEKREF